MRIQIFSQAHPQLNFYLNKIIFQKRLSINKIKNKNIKYPSIPKILS